MFLTPQAFVVSGEAGDVAGSLLCSSRLIKSVDLRPYLLKEMEEGYDFRSDNTKSVVEDNKNTKISNNKLEFSTLSDIIIALLMHGYLYPVDI